MKKIFVLTGEPSGDKLASNVIKSLNEKKKDIEYLGVCGNNLKSLGIKSIYHQKDITYMAFTDVIFNFLKINKKIDLTVNEVIKFNPSILLTSKTNQSKNQNNTFYCTKGMGMARGKSKKNEKIS